MLEDALYVEAVQWFIFWWGQGWGLSFACYIRFPIDVELLKYSHHGRQTRILRYSQILLTSRLQHRRKVKCLHMTSLFNNLSKKYSYMQNESGCRVGDTLYCGAQVQIERAKSKEGEAGEDKSSSILCVRDSEDPAWHGRLHSAFFRWAFVETFVVAGWVSFIECKIFGFNDASEEIKMSDMPGVRL